MTPNHRDNVRRSFRKYGCIPHANHHFLRLSEKLEQPFQVGFIVEVFKVIGCHQTFRRNLRTSAGSKPHLGWTSSERS